MGEFCLTSYMEPSEYCYMYGQRLCISRLYKFQEHRTHCEKRPCSDHSPRGVQLEGSGQGIGLPIAPLSGGIACPRSRIAGVSRLSAGAQKRELAPPRRCVSPEDQNETANSTPMVLGSFQYPRVAMPPMVWPNSSLSSVRFFPYTVTR